MLRALPEDLDLSYLRELPVPDAQAQLIALPGVGRKTAACVLLFSYGHARRPVDTHVSASARAWACCARRRRWTPSCTTRCSR